MKFQLIALVASAQAIRIRSQGSSGGPPNCSDMADAIYAHCDKNGDHGISWKEAKGCGAPADFKPAFDHIDADGDGVVDKPEFVGMCKKYGGGLAQGSSGGPPSCSDMADVIFEHCDADKNHEVSWKEARGCGAPADFKPVFEHIDQDGSGEVSRPEFMSECKKHMGLAQGGPPSCNDVADMVFEHCDGNSDGELSWAEASKCGAPAEFKPEFTKHAGANGTLDHAEFVDGCNDHTGLAQDQCEDVGEQILKHCDKDGNDQISWKEAKRCGAPKQWKNKFLKIAGADKEIDGKEFLGACRGGAFN